MIAVIFEVELAEGGRDGYLGWAERLGRELAAADGFLSIERFASLNRPNKMLSLSFWRDEEAVAAWRRLEPHRAAQRQGREALFADYRLRVAAVLRDYGMDEREQVPDGVSPEPGSRP
ncbi:antibiotic biosynthesis monooxygenase family protein [Chromobacterium haemolyticum]|uniref:antibiotic biosynthesis monooxygenase family protein n=1 Tax=Chromobacterium haemolyticum TaxID=394935 RepID=UPI0005BA420A|nr:antibiotic biosynthesis monooxygenase [Chromobacterium haemolyticum]